MWEAVVEVNHGQRVLGLDDGSVRVTIQHLLPSTTPAQVEDGSHAPEQVSSKSPGGENYFKVISEGTTGGARRRVEAILYTSGLGVPAAYYTPNDITLRGDVGISGVSFFAGGSIDKVDEVTIDRGTPAAYAD